MKSKRKTIVYIIAMFMWFVTSAGSLYYSLETNEIIGAILSGLTTMMFGGFILEGFMDLYIILKYGEN